MKEKFTKGPWIVNDGKESAFLQGKITTKSQGHDVVICDTPSPYFGSEVSKANANLIACVPDMYEVLEKVAQAQRDADYEIEHSDLLCALYDDIESLLKRARGK